MNQRLLSLDIFRGITIFAMILVNNPGSWNTIYSPLKHATWHGATPTDLIFPFFLFIVGVSICLALKKAKFNPDSHGKIILTAFKRSLILFTIGLFLNAFPEFDLEALRIPGVLQRIAIVFFICVILYLKGNWKTHAWIGVVLLLAYWFVFLFVPVPDIGIYNLEPGRNIAAWVDSKILTGHMWSVTGTWDPEGLLSTIPAIGTCLIGLIAGQWLSKEGAGESKVIKIMVTGCLLIVAGLAWGMIFPINKALWTSSFTLYTGGIALTFLGILYWFLDVRKNVNVKYFEPFKAFGTNAISAYVMAELLSATLSAIPLTTNGEDISLKYWLFQGISTVVSDPYMASLTFAALIIMIIFIPISIMYRRNILIKV